MNRKAPKCTREFPCGKTCISKNRNCWANLSSANNKIAETFSQFVNRLVGIGNNTQSVIGNNNPIDSIIESEKTKINILEKGVIPNITDGNTIGEVLVKLDEEINIGETAASGAVPVTVEVLPNDITNIPKLLNPESGETVDIVAETLNNEIEAGKRVKKILEKLEAKIETDLSAPI